MVLNFLFFTVKIKHNASSIEERIALHEQEMRLNARREAHNIEVASFPFFASRL